MRHATRRPLPAELVFPKLEIAFLEASMVAVAQSMGMLLAGVPSHASPLAQPPALLAMFASC
jgi:hypothetical protein